MTLTELAAQIGAVDSGMIIGARRPWALESEVRLDPIPADCRYPVEAKAAGYEYFLEVDIAREVLDVFGSRVPTFQDIAQLLIHYAEHDAYPSWAYDPQNPKVEDVMQPKTSYR